MSTTIDMAPFVPASRAKRRYSVAFPEVCCAAAAPWLALALRETRFFEPELIGQASFFCGIAFIIGIAVLFTSNICNIIFLNISILDGISIFRCAFLTSALTTIVAFSITRLDGIPRSVPILTFFVFGSLLLMSGLFRGRLKQIAERKHRNVRSEDVENIIVLGANRTASFYIRIIDTFSAGNVMAILDASPSLRNRILNGRRIIGAPEDLFTIIHEYKIHGIEIRRIVVAADRSELSQATWECLQSDASIEVEFLTEQHGGIVQHLADGPAAHPLRTAAFPLKTTANADIILAQRRKYWKLKGAIDVSVATLLLVILTPVMATVGLSVRLGIGSPVIFWQRRVGQNGAAFFLFKFRTLLVRGDGRGERPDEPGRISRLGSFLRRTRLDEIPQLLNVLRGDMAIIGPRPLLPIDQPPSVGIRLAVRPGITGWAQVHGGNLITPEEKNALDEYYIRNASFWLDLKILAKTAKVLLTGDWPRLKGVERTLRASPVKPKLGSLASLEAEAAVGPQESRPRGRVKA
jgi:lipopolysaccharide/colanic/teichoic acid biosynthesis glycosyltransferase